MDVRIEANIPKDYDFGEPVEGFSFPLVTKQSEIVIGELYPTSLEMRDGKPYHCGREMSEHPFQREHERFFGLLEAPMNYMCGDCLTMAVIKNGTLLVRVD